MKTATRLIALAVLLAGTFFVSSALACQTILWEGTTTGGAITAGDWVTNSFARVSGVGACSLQVSGAGQVHDNSPDAETAMHGRFMFLPNNLKGTPEEVVIFEAFSTDAGTGSVFKITFNGTQFILRAGAESATVSADSSHWNMVAFSFDNTGNSNLWVSSDPAFDISTKLLAPHGTISTNGVDAISSVKLGLPNGLGTFTGSAQFDDYESTRTEQPGMPALIGDGNNDGKVDSVDFLNVLDELFKVDQGEGPADCNLDGKVDSVDFLCILDAIFS